MKRFAAALAFTTTVLAFAPVPLTAQARQTGAAQVPAERTAAFDEDADAEAVRARFRDVLNRYPQNVGRVLRMDPSLLGNDGYMAAYPALAQFVAQYPQVARNPEFYLEGYAVSPYDFPRDARWQAIETFGDFLEGVLIVIAIAVVWSCILWLIKSVVEHRRWLRMSRIQTEVHTKLLDRFSSSDELLAYMKTPAGSRFLESAPLSVGINADVPARAASAPLNRILLSVQAGVVLMLAGSSLLFARTSVEFGEVRQMLYLMGLFGTFVGIGFVLSALASYVLSRRMGLMDGGTGAGAPPSLPSGPAGHAGSTGL